MATGVSRQRCRSGATEGHLYVRREGRRFQSPGTPGSMSPYINVTGTTQAMAINQGYIANNASLVTFTPPATCGIGTIFGVCGNGAGGWSINLSTNSQTINFGTSSGTTALSSGNRYDGCQFVCTVANTSFSIINSVGNLTIS